MTEDEEFYQIEMKQLHRDVERIAEKEANEFMDNHIGLVAHMTPHQVYVRAYKDALVDVILRQKLKSLW